MLGPSDECSQGRVWNSEVLTWGCVHKKVLIWLASAEERVGRIITSVILQESKEVDAAASIDASRRNGVKCPMPALGQTTKCGGLVGGESIDMVLVDLKQSRIRRENEFGELCGRFDQWF